MVFLLAVVTWGKACVQVIFVIYGTFENIQVQLSAGVFFFFSFLLLEVFES